MRRRSFRHRPRGAHWTAIASTTRCGVGLPSIPLPTSSWKPLRRYTPTSCATPCGCDSVWNHRSPPFHRCRYSTPPIFYRLFRTPRHPSFQRFNSCYILELSWFPSTHVLCSGSLLLFNCNSFNGEVRSVFSCDWKNPCESVPNERSCGYWAFSRTILSTYSSSFNLISVSSQVLQNISLSSGTTFHHIKLMSAN